MKIQLRFVMTLVATIGLALPVIAGEVHTISVDSEYELVDQASQTTIKMPGAGVIPELATPEMPYVSYKYLIGDSRQVIGVKLISFESEHLPGRHSMRPTVLPSVEPESYGTYESEDYDHESADIYPVKIIAFGGSGFYRGHQIANVTVYPFQYTPSSGELTRVSSLEIEFVYGNISSRLLSDLFPLTIEEKYSRLIAIVNMPQPKPNSQKKNPGRDRGQYFALGDQP